MALKRILIAVDDSPVAAHSVDVGLDLAKSLGGEVAFIHVVDPASSTIPEGGVPASELRAIDEQYAKRMLAAFCQRAPLQPPPLEFLAIGKPASEIIKAANGWPADLIVI